MKRTRLFHLSGNRYQPLPAKHHTRRIWDELAQGFDEYHVIARGKDCSFRHSVEGNIHLHLLPSLGKGMWPFFFSSWLLPLYVLRYRPTHLLVQCPVLGGLAAAFCSRLFRIPLFAELHGAHYFVQARKGWKGDLEHLIYRSLSRFTFLVASRIRTLSDDMSEHLGRVYGEKASGKAIIIPNRVDLGVFRFVKDSYALNGCVRFISVGSFSPVKNHLALLKDLSESGVDFRLTLVGAGALKEHYLNFAADLGIRDQLEIHESLDHQSLAALLPKHDVYVHYSLSEGVPRAILEAMAVGLPVVGTRVGFIKGVLRDGENAIVIDHPYADGLGAAVRALTESEELRSRLGLAARQDIVERFEWSRVFEQYRAAILEME